MSDKPLDCVGTDLTQSKLGKHDFRVNPLLGTALVSNASVPEIMASEILDNVENLLKSMPAPESQPHHIKVGRDYWEHLKNLPSMPHPPNGMMGGVLGLNIFVDEVLAPDEMQILNMEGKVLKTFWLDQ